MAIPALLSTVLLNPNLVFQKNDPFTTGVVYIPIGLASLAAQLRKHGHPTELVDCFGLAPNRAVRRDDLLFRGLTATDAARRVPAGTGAIFVYAINLTYHLAILELIKALRSRHPETPIIVFENTQAVTAYSLRRVLPEFFAAGATYVLTGEPEERALALLARLGESPAGVEGLNGVAYRSQGEIHFTPSTEKVQALDDLAFPAWDLLPIENYWKMRYAHGPLTSKRYLPILTSRGCPYPCRFCVIPETNDQKWRGRSAQSVVDEMAFFQQSLGVGEFHFEDVDPTVNDVRTRAICEEILRRGLRVSWKICSGTKVETLKSRETLELMARAGCRYISISPESGSQRLMKLMRKPFDYAHAVKMIGFMDELGIRSQACFVLGFPGEEAADRELTRQMARDLVMAGLDEIAQFIITPVPGSAIFDSFSGYPDLSHLNFSPSWRADYTELNSFRVKLYRDFLMWKLRYQPLKLMKQPFNFLSRRFETKMEMTPYRALHSVLAVRQWRQEAAS